MPGRRQSSPGSRQSNRTARLERRQRERHLRRLRRDLLVDVSVAILLVAAVLVMTAGLGVVALLEFAAGAVLIASFVVERRIRRRRSRSS